MDIGLLIVLAGFLCVSEAIPKPGHGALRGYCLTSADCDHDECCVSFQRLRGKRDLPSDLKRFVNGKCENLGTQGSACIFNGLQTGTKGGLYYHECPCKKGFTCEGIGVINRPVGEQGICQADVTVSRPCHSTRDCNRWECCVSNVRPIGKRGVLSSRAPGHCESIGGQGADCLVRNGSGRPSGLVFASCPCRRFMKCVGIGQRDIPLGEMGRCRYRRRGFGRRRPPFIY